MREREFHATLVEFVEYDEDTQDLKKDDLLALLKECEITFNPTGIYGNGTGYRKEYVQLRITTPLKSKLKTYTKYLSDVCREIYTSDGYFEYWGIEILVLPKKFIVRDEEIVKSEITSIEQKDIIYDNFKLKVLKSDFDDIEKAYIIETCKCAVSGNMLSASTTIGCAAERLLLLLSESYLQYLRYNNESALTISNFEKNIVNAPKAHKRLEGLYKTIEKDKKLFENLQFENHMLHFSFLDVIRQVRNEAGHPTGVTIEKSKLQSIVTNYDLLYDKIHEVIIKLPHELAPISKKDVQADSK
ncbi:hypothetical protein [Clostridium tagluense]|uniref:Uncharacterized protein n=1 Tax=Clostridium tagluense TaxID=360422 RepID=A0A401UU49_9CLOT|nr:hypothetical protein [Clostridium tagluense]GCD13073.1 hypothetical protein Ctaglu_46960 [Clostridium tagluense]